MSRPPWEFARVGDFALFLGGVLMVAAGVFLVADGASQIALYLLGTGLMVIGALLPRLSGTIKISPSAVELTVVQQLEATRREAEQRIPDRVEEAVGLAFKRLIESGALTGLPPEAPAPAPHAPPAARAGGRGIVVAAVAVVVLLGLVAIAAFWLGQDGSGNGTGPVPAPPGAAPPLPSVLDPPFVALVLLGVAAGAVAVVLYVRARRRPRKRLAPSDDAAERFARGIVAEMSARTD